MSEKPTKEEFQKAIKVVAWVQVDTEENEAEEMYTMLEAHEGVGLALANTSLQIIGKGGPYDGTLFTLDKPLITVGRTDDNDLILITA